VVVRGVVVAEVVFRGVMVGTPGAVGTNQPVRPSWMISQTPSARKAMTGMPEAWASRTTWPNVSDLEGKVKISADA